MQISGEGDNLAHLLRQRKHYRLDIMLCLLPHNRGYCIFLFALLLLFAREGVGCSSFQSDTTHILERIEYARSLRFRKPDSAKFIALQLNQIVTTFPRATALTENLLGNLSKDAGRMQDAALHYNKSLAIYRSLKNFSGVADTWNSIGFLHLANDDLEKSIMYFDSALVMYTRIRDSSNIAYTHMYRGQGLRKSGRYLLTIDEYFIALNLFDKLQDKKSVADVLNNLGLVYEKLEQWNKAIEYYERALAIKSDPFSRAITKVNLGSAYTHAFQFKQAEKNLNEALNHFDSVNYEEGKGAAMADLGKVFIHTSRKKEARVFFTQALQIASTLNSATGITACLNGLTEIDIFHGDYHNAEINALKSFKLAGDHALLERQAEAAMLLSQCYKGMGNYKSMGNYLETYLTLHDSLLHHTVYFRFSELEKKYESEKKEFELTLIKKQREELEENVAKQKSYLIILGSGLLCLLLIVMLITLLYHRNLSLKRALQEKNRALHEQQQLIEAVNQELREKAMRAQMNPHFIFNALNSIQFLVVKGDHTEAFHYLSTFSVLLRRTMEYSDLPQISLEDEIKILDSYLQLEALRFNNNFRYVISAPIEKKESIRIPPLIIQPIVENAIVHGLMASSGEKSLTVSFKIIDAYLCCEILDNGVGRVKAAKNKKAFNRDSRGILLSQQRIRIFNQSLHNDSLVTEDLYDTGGDAAGTKVTVFFRMQPVT